MDRKTREGERGYYLTREHALDFDRRSSSERSLMRHRAVAEKLKGFVSGGEFLDIGCGSARMLIAIAHELPGIRITGTDVSGEMLSLARKNVRESGLEDRVRLMLLSAEELGGFPDEKFDAVQSHGAFSGWLSPGESLAEIRRTLKHGGVLYLRDWNRSAPEEELTPCLVEASDEQKRRVRMAYESSYTRDEFTELLRGSPLRLVEFGTEGLWMEAVLRAEK